MTETRCSWWKEGVCYQVWPASFKDSNNDGLGDLQGIISKLDYLKDLGVDFIWLSPCYDSPRYDMGYDVRNYEAIDPDMGTLEDMEALISGLHQRGMKIILDLVVNHTSIEHRWFQESMKSRDNEYSDWYIWKDPKIRNGQKVPPNNWGSIFGGSAWEYVEARDQYYLHLFHVTQADTNWENPRLRRALYQSAILFWLDHGIDGFRVDAVGLYSKPQDFPDIEITDPNQKYADLPFSLISNGPRMHEFLREQRKEALDPYGDVVLIGELGHADQEDLLKYLDPKHRELDMVFDMSVVMPDGFSSPMKEHRRFNGNLAVIRSGFTGPQKIISEGDGWSTVFLENHDNPRSISKFGSIKPELSNESGKCLALLLSVLSGTTFVYQGQELGMANLPKDWPISEMRDEWWLEEFREVAHRFPGNKEKLEQAREAFQTAGRDHARTPMQWTVEEPAAGFSSAKPWIKANSSFRTGVTVAEEQAIPGSLWNFWKCAIALRKRHLHIFAYGSTDFLDTKNDKVMYLTKKETLNSEAVVAVAINFADEPQPLHWPSEMDRYDIGSILLGTRDEGSLDQLAPWEGRVYEVHNDKVPRI